MDTMDYVLTGTRIGTSGKADIPRSGVPVYMVVEIWPFGQWPTVTQFAQMLTAPLIEIGLGFIAPYVDAIASFIMAPISAYDLGASSIVFSLEYWAATASLALNPYVLAAFGTAVLAACPSELGACCSAI